MNSIRFGDMVKDFHGIGEFPVRDLLPLIPPGATLSQNSQVKPHQIGKIPGRFSHGVWSGLSGPWPTFGLAERDQQLAAEWPTQNVGLRAADFPGIDCDTSTKEALEMVEALISRVFGDGAPARERGNAPRALFVFRRIGEDAIRKNRIVFKDTEDREHAVEVLGLGQQYVISGIHPSGAAYEWREFADTQGRILKRDLLTTKASGLKGINAADVSMFMSRLQAEINARGWTVTSTVAPKYGAGGRADGVLVSAAEPLIDNDIALAALRAIPNVEDALPTREDLVAIVSSFKHAVGRNAEELYPDVVAWATEHGWADEPYIEKVWLSIKTARVSPDHLINTARKFGFRGDAVLDFREFGDDGSAGERQLSVNERIEHAQAVERDARDALNTLARKLVYWPDEQVFIVKDNGVTFSAEALNNSSYGTTVAPAGTSGVRSTANQLRNAGLVQEVAGMVYLPGKPQLVSWERNGRPGLFYNCWHAHHIPLPASVTDEDVKPWLDHVEYLVPEEAERNKLLDFFAHIVQRRGEKIRWAPLLIGRQGTGKDLLIKPLMMFFGHNAQDLKPDFLTARFNGFLENELLIVQEMKRSNKTSGVYNSIKTMLSGTAADVNMVEQKYKSPYAVPNVVNMLFFSNHLDAMEIDPDDRRFFVIMSDVVKREYEYYRSLADDFYKAQSGWRKVIRWLLQRDLADFSASEAPPSTSSKEIMIEAQRSGLYLALSNALTHGIWKDVQVITADDIYRAVKTDYNFPVDQATRAQLTNLATIASELSHLGWLRHPKQLRVGDDVIRPWVRSADILDWPSTKLRNSYLSSNKQVAVSDF